MDAATLRLILIVVGGALLVALYLWERRRAEARSDGRPGAAARRRAPAAAPKREPNLGGLDGDDEPPRVAPGSNAMSAPPPPTDRQAPDPERQPEPERSPEWESQWSPEWEPELPETAADDVRADRDEAPAPTDEDAEQRPEREPEPEPDQAPHRGPDGLVVQLYVVTAGEPFDGHRILSISEEHKLMPGDMDIFHRHANDDPAQPPLFSMATMHKPGTFPFDDMDGFSTKGLALFAQLYGDSSDLMVFDEMLAAARALADALDGEVQERGGSPLTLARADALRAEVLALLQQEWDASEHR
ncbi:MAG: cell division protein ZipA [Thiohalocapsa sp.]|nr:cell division protein ZipA [Thiohalocapsa sp.]